MPLLTLSIGSNINAAENIRTAVTMLRAKFPSLICSSVYESESVGFDGDNFMNLATACSTNAPLSEIKTFVKSIENELGRDRSQPRFSGRTMDIDILTFGDSTGAECSLELPRNEITENAFVLQPMAEILPDEIHALSQQSYSQLWANYDKAKQKLWVVPFQWNSEA